MDKIIFFEKIQHLIELHKKQEDEADLRGENYNIFNVLGLTTNETQLHSAFIANLLDPKGKHGLGNTPLKEFLSIIRFPNMDRFSEDDFASAEITVEYHIGAINVNYTEGGYIDILIRIKDWIIVIENKIYAGDQQSQIFRYKNFCKRWTNHILLYLTLDGHIPSEGSTQELVANRDFKCLSYRHEILKWLNTCLSFAVSRPLIRETIQQYINILKQLTNTDMDYNELSRLYETMSEYPDVVASIMGNMWGYRRYLIENYLVKPLKEWSEGNGYEWYDDKDVSSLRFGIYRPYWNKMIALKFTQAEFKKPELGVWIWRSKDDREQPVIGPKTDKDWPYGCKKSRFYAFDESVAKDLIDGKIFDEVRDQFIDIMKIIEDNGLDMK